MDQLNTGTRLSSSQKFIKIVLFYFKKTDMEFTQNSKPMYCDFIVETFDMISYRL